MEICLWGLGAVEIKVVDDGNLSERANQQPASLPPKADVRKNKGLFLNGLSIFILKSLWMGT